MTDRECEAYATRIIEAVAWFEARIAEQQWEEEWS
jgi:hypothetical protein